MRSQSGLWIGNRPSLMVAPLREDSRPDKHRRAVALRIHETSASLGALFGVLFGLVVVGASACDRLEPTAPSRGPGSVPQVTDQGRLRHFREHHERLRRQLASLKRLETALARERASSRTSPQVMALAPRSDATLTVPSTRPRRAVRLELPSMTAPVAGVPAGDLKAQFIRRATSWTLLRSERLAY
jgi:hypothetical protein